MYRQTFFLARNTKQTFLILARCVANVYTTLFRREQLLLEHMPACLGLVAATCLVSQDVKYGVLNSRAMELFNDPKSGDEWLKFLGSRSEHSPYQINFVDNIPDDITPLNLSIPGCGSPGYECSCADCASAPYCQQVSIGNNIVVKQLSWLIHFSCSQCLEVRYIT